MYEGAREKHLPFYILKKFIDVQMIYNVLISAVQQTDSVIYIYIYIYIYIHTHTHSFSYSFPLWFITGY